MTAQVAERLIYGGNKEIGLFSNPLSLYLKQTGISFVSPHTANWRGYVGTWKIIETDGVERFSFKLGDFPVTEKIAERTIALPFYNNLSKDEVGIVCDELRKAIDKL